MSLDFPVEHLSASSLTKFIRCPRQWQDSYLFGNKGPSSSALLIGSATHLMLSKSLKGEDPSGSWEEVMTELDGTPVIWKEGPDVCRQIAEAHAYHYFEKVGKYLTVLETEKEILIDIPDVPIPVLGYVDIETPDRIIDLKTTGYFNRKVALNPEWKLQANVYQLAHAKPAEFHVLTRSKTDPLVLPDSIGHDLHVSPPDRALTESFVRDVFKVIAFYLDEFGENPWPGNVTHPWSGKYCLVSDCCQRV